MLNSIHNFLVPIGMVWNSKLFAISGVKISLGNLIMALIMLLFAPRLSRAASRAIDKRLIQKFVEDKSSQVTYKTFAFYGCLGGFVTLSLAIAGIPLTVFTIFGGALAIGVGFGSQNIVNNFISGIILLVEKPIKVGDVVELDNISGAVLAIGTRSTQVKTAEGKIYVVPNSFFLEKSVLNWSYEQAIVRTSVSFGVAYGTDVGLVERVSKKILDEHPFILKAPIPMVHFENFSESNLDFVLHFWCDLNSVSSLSAGRSEVRFAIDGEFKKNNIEMAFAQRDLNMKKPIEVKVLA